MIRIMGDVKQVIVMRTDLDMPIGKMVSQGAHASEGALTSQNIDKFEEVLTEWGVTGRTKITVGVKSLEKLSNLVKKADELGVHYCIVKDEGRTVFKEPTITCVCFGVDTSENLDPITGRLRLLK
jgi:PTH2 family peptidyl-tRNA hydrolase